MEEGRQGGINLDFLIPHPSPLIPNPLTSSVRQNWCKLRQLKNWDVPGLFDGTRS
jgi:hypothetical protein